MANTLQKGRVRYIVFQEDGAWYAAGLEFNIVESGDTPQEAMILLFEALQGYIESAQKVKARPQILNQQSDPEYETLWSNLNNPQEADEIPYPIFSFGTTSVGQSLAAA